MPFVFSLPALVLAVRGFRTKIKILSIIGMVLAVIGVILAILMLVYAFSSADLYIDDPLQAITPTPTNNQIW
jgi:hypothetical protein